MAMSRRTSRMCESLLRFRARVGPRASAAHPLLCGRQPLHGGGLCDAPARCGPDFCEVETAQKLRALSPTATPNARIVAIADDLLGRGGRMVRAIGAIGRGQDCYEGVPFALDIGPS